MKSYAIETDRKSIILSGEQRLWTYLPPRIERFRLQLDRFQFPITHIPGKDLSTADTPSWASLSSCKEKGLQEKRQRTINRINWNTSMVHNLSGGTRRNHGDQVAIPESPATHGSEDNAHTLQSTPIKTHSCTGTIIRTLDSL